MSQYLNTPPPNHTVPAQHHQPQPQRHALAVVSLVLGIIGLFPCLFFCSIIGLICGIIALILIQGSNGTKTGKGMAIAGIILGVIGTILVIVYFSIGKSQDRKTGKAVTPDATLEIAESNIMSSSKGIAYSNSEEGLELAKEFSAQIKTLALLGTDDLGKGDEFITHCQLHEDSVAFIVHAPKLNSFNDESKESFCEFGWMVANSVLSKAELPADTQLVVAVKGNILYQNMYFGTYTKSAQINLLNGVTKKTKDEKLLKTFFKGSSTQ